MDQRETGYFTKSRPRDTHILAGEPPDVAHTSRDLPALVRLTVHPARSLLSGLAPGVVVVAGYGAAVGPWSSRATSQLVGYSCLAGMALAFGGLLFPGRALSRLAAALVALGLFSLPFAADSAGTIAFAWGVRGVLKAVAWLAPLVVAALVLLRRGAWLSGGGCCLVLFAGVTSLAYTVSWPNGGMGFFFRWAS